jgi:hypothetical protein
MTIVHTVKPSSPPEKWPQFDLGGFGDFDSAEFMLVVFRGFELIKQNNQSLFFRSSVRCVGWFLKYLAVLFGDSFLDLLS